MDIISVFVWIVNAYKHNLLYGCYIRFCMCVYPFLYGLKQYYIRFCMYVYPFLYAYISVFVWMYIRFCMDIALINPDITTFLTPKKN